LLKDHYALLEKVSTRLMTVEVMDGEEFKAMLSEILPSNDADIPPQPIADSEATS
jgi:hypothetical protein